MRDPIIIEALLVRGEGEHVRVILGPYCLDFAADDVLDLQELPWPYGVTEGSAMAARLTLKRAPRLLGLGSATRMRMMSFRRGVHPIGRSSGPRDPFVSGLQVALFQRRTRILGNPRPRTIENPSSPGDWRS